MAVGLKAKRKIKKMVPKRSHTGKEIGNDFRDEVWSIPGGEAIRLCKQCGTCAGSCPNANFMDYSPRKVIAMVRANMKEEVLSSNSMWWCLSCYLCTVRCPQDIHITDLMYVLKQLAIREGYVKKRGRSSNLSKGIVETVRKYGRVWELEMMVRYYLRTNPLALIANAPLGLKMILRGRMPLKPHRIKNRKQVRKIVEMAEAMEARE
jgi:heterodisulfide reductase subunit C